MTCSKCGAEHAQAGDSDTGYVRAICYCEREQRCFKCKRGDFHPVNQALLDLEYEVRRYACSRHGHLDAEGFSVPTAPVVETPTPSRRGRGKTKEATAPVIYEERPQVDEYSLAGYRAVLDTSRELVTCLNCGVEQKFCDFVVRDGTLGNPVPYCPLCHDGRPKYSGKTW